MPTKISELSSQDVFANRIKHFQKLMRFKIREILLVSSMYDFYLFEEDGRLYEVIREEYHNLNLSHAPEITHVSSGAEALEMINNEDRFDLIITTLHIEDMTAVRFAQQLRMQGSDLPVIVLAYDNFEAKELQLHYDTSVFDKIFIWSGDYRLLIGIFKYIEDKQNVKNDTDVAEVQVIILVEDNVKYYSAFLPMIYTEILNQSQRLISEGVNLTHKYLRMRARPKILLCTNYEEAWEAYKKFEPFVLGVISDIDYKRQGKKDPEAGIRLALNIRSSNIDVPVLLQSSNIEGAIRAKEIGVSFIHKNSPQMLHELRDFLINNFSFGDFVFRLPDGREVGRAKDLKTLEEMLQIVPDETIRYHADRNHFSNWLKARTEFWLAHKLRPKKVSDFSSITALRNLLVEAVQQYFDMRQRGIVTDFVKENFNPERGFARMGNGSLGGKARGLAFVNSLMNNYGLSDKFPMVDINVPPLVVIATDVFDDFMENNHILGFALNCDDDIEIKNRFIQVEYFPEEILIKLREFLEIVKGPLAVRSSSLLEDSQFQPLAGVYETYMIPNSNDDIEVRLNELLQTIKSVYASTFYRAAKDYMKVTAYRLEEEKMAVIIQRLVGSAHEDRFYPEFAGVAKSYNFYPLPPQKAEDGIAMAGLGLGKIVVDGGSVVRFCPKYPRHLLQFYSTKETIRNAQQEFFALDLSGGVDLNLNQTHDMLVKKYSLDKAEKDQTLYYSGSTYSAENDTVYDGISRPGKRVVTFAPILKHKVFPLAEILDLILELGTFGMGTPVEIEYAVNLNPGAGKPQQFALLQMRPLVLSRELDELDIKIDNSENLLCSSEQVLGNGVYEDLYDIVFVDIDTFDRGKSRDIAQEISYFNSTLIREGKPYILIGVGRWGSLDPWLGIPVSWDQISGSAVIVEASFKDFSVTPSQGSHFFQNITSFRVGYFTVNEHSNLGYIDWEWLRAQPAIEKKAFTARIRLETPLTVKINGHKNKGIILKRDE